VRQEAVIAPPTGLTLAVWSCRM